MDGEYTQGMVLGIGGAASQSFQKQIDFFRLWRAASIQAEGRVDRKKEKKKRQTK